MLIFLPRLVSHPCHRLLLRGTSFVSVPVAADLGNFGEVALAVSYPHHIHCPFLHYKRAQVRTPVNRMSRPEPLLHTVTKNLVLVLRNAHGHESISTKNLG